MECKECGKYLTQNEIKDGWCHACIETINPLEQGLKHKEKYKQLGYVAD